MGGIYALERIAQSSPKDYSPSMEDFAALLSESLAKDDLYEGSVVKGKIVSIVKDMAVIDVGLKMEGRVAVKEFSTPGKPDIVLPKWQVAVFVHGCFWHRHECRISKLPSSRRSFWKNKLSANRDRDSIAILALLSALSDGRSPVSGASGSSARSTARRCAIGCSTTRSSAAAGSAA